MYAILRVNLLECNRMNLTKQRILQAARAVLIQQGGSRFSMRKVAVEASMTLSNVQYHYKTKTDLLGALLACSLEDYKQTLLHTINQSGSGKAGLSVCLQKMLSAEEDSDEIKLSLAIAVLAEDEAISDQLDAIYEEFYGLLTNFLSCISGHAQQSIQVQKSASLLLTVINGYGTVSHQIGVDSVTFSGDLTDIIWTKLSVSE